MSSDNFLNYVETITFSDISIESILLSKREWECATLILAGKTSKEIARVLKLSHRTIEDYIYRMKKKLNCKNKSELIFLLTQVGRKTKAI